MTGVWFHCGGIKLKICGCDEVGRGSGAAEIYVCAVILDPTRPIEGLADSKKLSAHKREILADKICEKSLAWCMAKADLKEIEQLNVHYATLLAMKRAIEGLHIKPDRVLVDGKYKPDIVLPTEAIIKGDEKIPSISAASILAKVLRDKAMDEIHELYPVYGFNHNKGYLTPQHLQALAKYGPCPLHRKTYAPIKNLINHVSK